MIIVSLVHSSSWWVLQCKQGRRIEMEAKRSKVL